MRCLTEYRVIYMIEFISAVGDLIFRRFTHRKKSAVEMMQRNMFRVRCGDSLTYRKLSKDEMQYVYYLDVED